MKENRFSTDGREFRAVTFLPNGQRFEGWLPAGEYLIMGECTLDGIDAVKLSLSESRPDYYAGYTWYVGRVAFECRADQPLACR